MVDKEEMKIQKAKQLRYMPILWKYDSELGIAYFCPHCKTFQCTESGVCAECSGNVDWDKQEEYKGKVRG